MPGIDPRQNVLVTVEDDILMLRAERTEKPEVIRHSEFRYGSFARATRLPKARPGEATTEYRHGVLTVTVPITAMTGEPTTIDVTHLPE